jgi:hypothetical protein
MPSQAQIDAFRNAPDVFLRTNSVVWMGPAPENQAIINVFMQDALGASARIRTGGRFLGLGNVKANADKFYLKWADNPNGGALPGEPTFPAHWSGYKAGQGRDAILPAGMGGPNLMLTPEFTGCAAVGRVNADGSAQFSHYNLMSTTDPGMTLDDTEMRAIADAAYGGGHTTLTKGDVRAVGKHSEAVKATVVGFRRLGRWEFWIQIRESKASGEQIRCVRPL